MRSEINELGAADPITEQEGRIWATSSVGLEVKQRALEESAMTTLSLEESPRPRFSPVAAFAAGISVVAIVAIPLMLISRSDPGTTAAATPERILADGVVTEAEVRAAGEAVEQCMQDQGVSGSFSLEDDLDQGIFSHRGIQYDTPSQEESILNDCRAEHMGRPVEDGARYQVEQIWDAQNQPTPSELFGFYDKVVRCTEDWTGTDYGDMAQDATGAMSAEGEATKGRAASQAGAEYQSCVYRVSAIERQGFPGGPILFSDDSGQLMMPPGWMATHTKLTPDDDSMNELIAVSTYRLQPGRACAGMPLRSLDDLTSSDLLVIVSEVTTSDDETPRPGSFSSVIDGVNPDVSAYSCDSPGELQRFAVLDTVSFTEAGRSFSVVVAVGSDVPQDQRGKVMDMLDSLVVDAN